MTAGTNPPDLAPTGTDNDNDVVDEDLFGTINDDEVIQLHQEQTTTTTDFSTPFTSTDDDVVAAVAAADDALNTNNVIVATNDDDAAHDETATTNSRIQQILQSNPPPPPLPAGWYMKPSRSAHPGNYYYFHQETGYCCWEYPATSMTATNARVGGSGGGVAEAEGGSLTQESLAATAAAAAAAVKSILKRSDNPANDDEGGNGDTTMDNTTSPRKRSKTTSTDNYDHHHGSNRGDRPRDKDHRRDHREAHQQQPSQRDNHEPKEVRVLHILKKHKDSRRPSSWRVPKITDTKEKAISDLRELLSILHSASASSDDVGSSLAELRATFEELAKTESDCSSAKRGGDLGFFGRKKMQPAFEKASFGLRVGELSDVVDTSSGVHVILRLA